jgi:hypothetical protein
MTDEPAVLLAELVQFLGHQPTAVRRLVAAHVDDGSGRCVTCALAGQGGRLQWPCLISVAAGLAERSGQRLLDGVCSDRRN